MGARARRSRRSGRRPAGRWLKKLARPGRGLLVAAAAVGVILLALALLPAPPRRPPAPASVETTPPVDREMPARPAAAPAPREPRPDDELTHEPAPARPAAARPAPPFVGPPRAAIVIDDLGQTLVPLHQLADLGIPLSVAVLPGLGATEATVRDAARLGLELLLHLPMEPQEEGKNPGPGALLTTMTAAEIRARLHEDLAAVPGAVGVNNHMGSRFTADPQALAALMAGLKDAGLFFLDSRTTPRTRGFAVALEQGVPAAQRDVFIDADMHPDAIRVQLRLLVSVARRRGTAIGIGHPHAVTIAALRELRDELAASGVTWVPVSALVRTGAAPGEAVAAAPAHAAAAR